MIKMNIAMITALALMACGQNTLPVGAANPCLVNGLDTCASKAALTATISLESEKQTMHSFGASDCWGIKFIGKNWPEAKRNQIADLLFSKEMDQQGNPKGIGLSMWRINIGAGSYEQGVNSNISSDWRREESFQLPNGSYDWTKQAGNQWFARAAKKTERGKPVAVFHQRPGSYDQKRLRLRAWWCRQRKAEPAARQNGCFCRLPRRSGEILHHRRIAHSLYQPLKRTTVGLDGQRQW